MNNKKMQISQDTLYKYLTEHNVKILRIAELMGKSLQAVSTCFNHNKNSHGNIRYFSVENIKKLNETLPILAHDLRSCMLKFGSDQVYTNKHGRTYDPGMIEPLKKLGKLLNLTKLVERLLGWNRRKRASVITETTSKAYGNISEDDVALINAEILAIAGVLDGVEVVPDPHAYGNEL